MNCTTGGWEGINCDDELASAFHARRSWPGAVPPYFYSFLPLAWWMGQATEELADGLGEAIGGLLNATFGNAAELIIALTALHAGLHDIVKASIAGSIIGNILLVLGAAMLAGGLRHPEQHFNPAGARSQATMLTLAAIALVLPATFQAAANTKPEGLNRLSVSISVVLLVAYLLNLVYALITHPALFAGSHVPEKGKANISVRRASVVLAATTAGIAWMSEIMVKAIEPTVHELGLSDLYYSSVVHRCCYGKCGRACNWQSLQRARTAWTYHSRLRSAQAYKWHSS